MSLSVRVYLFVLLVGTSSLNLSAQTPISAPCGFGSATQVATTDTKTLWHGFTGIPRNAIRPHNLAWELPIAAVTGALIAQGDSSAANRIQSKSLQDVSSRWSNIGLAMELGAGALTWTGGCVSHRSRAAETGFTALGAMAAAGVMDQVLKLGFNREYPYDPGSTGRFWHGGRSFPSGHSAMSFAFASVVAHRYPHNPWVKWGAYALATGVSLSRYPAKKHFPSDIIIGATLGYVTGSYVADHTLR
ncbi:MAG TPA: phosphatase PAP2 family protein [Terriglobales bacterium]|nr:phosphatase PAP2 family protein [Terriglobales bacterium]